MQQDIIVAWPLAANIWQSAKQAVVYIAYLLPVLTACLLSTNCLPAVYCMSTTCLQPVYPLLPVYCMCLLPAYCLLHNLPTVYSAACLLLTSLHAYCVPYWQPTLSPAYCLL